LNRLPLIARAACAGLLTGLPVAFAGVIVSTLLARARDLSAALASNLLGSVVGGCLEYASMLVGLDGLALLAIVLYLGALYLLAGPLPDRRRLTSATQAAHRSPKSCCSTVSRSFPIFHVPRCETARLLLRCRRSTSAFTARIRG